MARFFEVTGTVDVRGVQSPTRGLVRPQVIARRIQVPDLPGQRAVFFETIFDDASRIRAESEPMIRPEPGKRSTLQFVWSLE